MLLATYSMCERTWKKNLETNISLIKRGEANTQFADPQPWQGCNKRNSRNTYILYIEFKNQLLNKAFFKETSRNHDQYLLANKCKLIFNRIIFHWKPKEDKSGYHLIFLLIFLFIPFVENFLDFRFRLDIGVCINLKSCSCTDSNKMVIWPRGNSLKKKKSSN